MLSRGGASNTDGQSHGLVNPWLGTKWGTIWIVFALGILGLTAEGLASDPMWEFTLFLTPHQLHPLNHGFCGEKRKLRAVQKFLCIVEHLSQLHLLGCDRGSCRWY